MKIILSIGESIGKNESITFVLEPDAADRAKYSYLSKGKLNSQLVELELLEGAKFDEIHGDLIGLTALLIAAPLLNKCYT